MQSENTTFRKCQQGRLQEGPYLLDDGSQFGSTSSYRAFSQKGVPLAPLNWIVRKLLCESQREPIYREVSLASRERRLQRFVDRSPFKGAGAA